MALVSKKKRECTNKKVSYTGTSTTTIGTGKATKRKTITTSSRQPNFEEVFEIWLKKQKMKETPPVILGFQNYLKSGSSRSSIGSTSVREANDVLKSGNSCSSSIGSISVREANDVLFLPMEEQKKLLDVLLLPMEEQKKMVDLLKQKIAVSKLYFLIFTILFSIYMI
jgi:hypothetical protein